MSMEFSLLVAYGALFVAAEGSALALAFFLRQLGKTEQLWIIAFAGVVVGIVFLVFLYYRASEIDRWKSKILELTEATNMEDDFKPWRKWWYRGYRGFGSWPGLIWIVPVFIILGLLWYSIAF